METRGLFFFDGPTPFFRCAVCKKHQPESQGGTVIKLGQDIQGIVCRGQCEATVRQLIQTQFPDALPVIDDHARLVR